MHPKPARQTEHPDAAERSAKAPYHHGDLPRTLVAAATRLLESGGSAHVTLRSTAQAAGVSIAAPYRHFASRAALFACVLTEGFHDLARCTSAARDAQEDPIEALLACGVAYVRFAAARPQLYRLMFGPECDKQSFPELMLAGQAALAVLEQAVAACQASGVIGPADVPQLALTGWSLTHGLASLYTDGLLTDSPAAQNIEATARIVIMTLINGVRPV